jgi:5'-nucleotidase
VDATKVGTITQMALDDDSGAAGVTRTVDWGDGTSAVTWTSGATIDHTYAAVGRYVPTVTLRDAADNSVEYTLDAIVLGDVMAPTGSVAVSPSTAWTSFTHVVATPSALSDDVSPQGMVRVHVAWGDGTSTDSTGAAALDHVYAAAGTYDVATTITDEAGNPTDLPASSVTVSDDTVGPKVTLTLPAKKHSVQAWKTLRGKATDAQTGVKSVSLKAVEKRGAAWYGYNASTKKWVKASSKAKAFSRSVAFSLSTTARNRWRATLAGLRKGTLVYKVKAVDQVGNTSGTVSHKTKLTRA